MTTQHRAFLLDLAGRDRQDELMQLAWLPGPKASSLEVLLEQAITAATDLAPVIWALLDEAGF
jgi:hypothetical protein